MPEFMSVTSIPNIRTSRRSGTTGVASTFFQRAPIPHALFARGSNRSPSPERNQTTMTVDELATPKISRMKPSAWRTSDERKTRATQPLSDTDQLGYGTPGRPRLSTSTEGTYVSSIDGPSTSTDYSTSPSSRSLASSHNSSPFRFSLSSRSRIFGMGRHGQESPKSKRENKHRSVPNHIQLSDAAPSTPSPKQTMLSSALNFSLPNVTRTPARRTLGLSTRSTNESKTQYQVFLDKPYASSVIGGHVRSGSQSTTATTTTTTSTNSLPQFEGLDTTRSLTSDVRSRVLRDLAVYSNSSDAADQDQDEDFGFPLGTVKDDTIKPSTFSRKLGAALAMAQANTRSPKSKSSSNHKKKKLVISGLTMNDQTAMLGVRRWCEVHVFSFLIQNLI